jgi:2',3'-cyclic-nucleotide 2'-phosphodiesterase (5'-nucleotidase family)
MASTMVKMRRLQKIEAALFQKARNLAQVRAIEKQSIPLLTSPTPEEAILVAQLAAMPDMDRLATLQRYQTSLDRQLSKVIGEIRVLTMGTTDNSADISSPDHRKIQTIRTIEKNSDGSSTAITRLSE